MRITLGPYRDFLREGKLPEASDPDDIARALQGVFDVSKSLRERITIVGGAECSFIAAVSHWLFDLKVYVENSRGETLFMTSMRSEQAQVHVVYKETDQLLPATVSKSSFVLGSSMELLRYTSDSRLRLVRTRVAWNSCLKYTFGQDFIDIMGLAGALGGFLGGAARIFQALAKGEFEVSVFSRELFIDHAEASYGRGFIKRFTTKPGASATQMLAVLSCQAMLPSLRFHTSQFQLTVAHSQVTEQWHTVVLCTIQVPCH